MKNKLSIIGLILMLCAANAYAQDTIEKYRRSSLHMVLIESETFPSKESVMKSWDNYEISDKYNKHFVASKVMNPAQYAVTEATQNAEASKMSQMGSSAIAGAKSSASSATGGAYDDEAAAMPAKIEQYIAETGLAKQLVSKWFNVSATGEMDMTLVQERGFYNASEMDAAIASGQARGLASLADAGEELIANTFVTFSKLNYVSNEVAAGVVLTAAKLKADKIKIPTAQAAAIAAAELAYEKAKEGYSVWTTTWLYQLEWNTTVASEFWDMWGDKAAFDNSDIFKMTLVGQESNQSLVTFSLTESRTEEEIIDMATVRNIDNVFAKLQKQYDVFKPKTPITGINPITAQIGLKEGLDYDDSFEVLERVLNSKTGLTEYKVVGKASINKNEPIWDNRYNAGATDASEVTVFKGSKKIQAGMLLRLVK